MACYFFLAAIVMLVFGGVTMPIALTLATALLVGMTVHGGFNGFWALAARLYPAGMRSTGVGWALGVGRIGAVLGPIVRGILVGAHFSLFQVFGVSALSMVVAAMLTLSLRIR